jgi:hypothetical protein
MQWNWKLPLSGDIDQKIEPDLFFGNIIPEVGDSEIEKEVFCKTASYGTQIGLMTKILLDMAKRVEMSEKGEAALEELDHISKKVEEIKGRKKNRMRESAKRMMEKLRERDKGAFKDVLSELQKNKGNAS